MATSVRSLVAILILRYFGQELTATQKAHGRTVFDHKAKVVYTKRECFAAHVFKVSTIAP
jgi:hypothetical protein